MNNREIKFRVWDTERKKFYEWKDDEICLSINLDGTICAEIDDDVQKNGLHEHDAQQPPDRYIFLQYTGLKDKNGKEIYEGDILLLESFIDDKTFNIPVTFEDGMFVAKGSGLLCHYEGKTVIGNIYENPTKGERRC
jgi:uncharacterized phage protein (TIGR01671 family)